MTEHWLWNSKPWPMFLARRYFLPDGCLARHLSKILSGGEKRPRGTENLIL